MAALSSDQLTGTSRSQEDEPILYVNRFFPGGYEFEPAVELYRHKFSSAYLQEVEKQPVAVEGRHV
jgi:hypothetical protein